jgi:hypothetical protein
VRRKGAGQAGEPSPKLGGHLTGGHPGQRGWGTAAVVTHTRGQSVGLEPTPSVLIPRLRAAARDQERDRDRLQPDQVRDRSRAGGRPEGEAPPAQRTSPAAAGSGVRRPALRLEAVLDVPALVPGQELRAERQVGLPRLPAPPVPPAPSRRCDVSRGPARDRRARFTTRRRARAAAVAWLAAGVKRPRIGRWLAHGAGARPMDLPPMPWPRLVGTPPVDGDDA